MRRIKRASDGLVIEFTKEFETLPLVNWFKQPDGTTDDAAEGRVLDALSNGNDCAWFKAWVVVTSKDGRLAETCLNRCSYDSEGEFLRSEDFMNMVNICVAELNYRRHASRRGSGLNIA